MPKGKNKKRKQRDFEEDETYTVERILKKRVVDGRTQYLLKWMNYPESESTWEPQEHLDCPDLIAEFEKRTKEPSAVQHKERDGDSSVTKDVKSVTESVSVKGHIGCNVSEPPLNFRGRIIYAKGRRGWEFVSGKKEAERAYKNCHQNVS